MLFAFFFYGEDFEDQLLAKLFVFDVQVSSKAHAFEVC